MKYGYPKKQCRNKKQCIFWSIFLNDERKKVTNDASIVVPLSKKKNHIEGKTDAAVISQIPTGERGKMEGW
jgi:hypothetical protein